MALILPILMTIMFGSFEAGHFFWNQHVLTKAVRDGARFAGRQPFGSFDKVTCKPTQAVKDVVSNVTSSGKILGGTPRNANWEDVVVTVDGNCSAATKTGIYVNNTAGAPFVLVEASVTFDTLFVGLGFEDAQITIQADSQAAVMGF